MANSPSKVVLIAGAIMGIGAMVVLNSMNKAPKTEEEQEQESQAEAQKNAPPPKPMSVPSGKAAYTKISATQPSLPTAGRAGPEGSDLVGFGQDKVVGSSAAGPEVNIRYSWTPAVQSDPKKVYDAVAAVKSAMPNARVHVINTDENPGSANGVYIGSKQIAPAAADGSITVSAAAVKAAVGAGSKK